jgi:hypothetical protein
MERAVPPSFTFDFDAEEVWIGEDPENAHRPGVLSQGTYGAKVAVPQLLALLERRGVRATFFVPGRVAERHPERVAAIVKAGHELAHPRVHAHLAVPALARRGRGRADQGPGRAAVVRARDHRVPLPVLGFQPAYAGLLAQHGFGYSSNMMDDLWPYRHDGSPLVEVPIQWILDDAPHFWFDNASWTKSIASTATVRTIWEEEFLGIRQMGGCCVFTMHPQIIGPAGPAGLPRRRSSPSSPATRTCG